ncbi:hypothetical protein B0H10DRAFT_1955061 [Mycena sp. CBHHK59/15]|nr:hypothetical protein B0H10DRAFT_1955061 [Mycena sp. CBHHK59/15]
MGTANLLSITIANLNPDTGSTSNAPAPAPAPAPPTPPAPTKVLPDSSMGTIVTAADAIVSAGKVIKIFDFAGHALNMDLKGAGADYTPINSYPNSADPNALTNKDWVLVPQAGDATAFTIRSAWKPTVFVSYVTLGTNAGTGTDSQVVTPGTPSDPATPLTKLLPWRQIKAYSCVKGESSRAVHCARHGHSRRFDRSATGKPVPSGGGEIFLWDGTGDGTAVMDNGTVSALSHENLWPFIRVTCGLGIAEKSGTTFRVRQTAFVRFGKVSKLPDGTGRPPVAWDP